MRIVAATARLRISHADCLGRSRVRAPLEKTPSKWKDDGDKTLKPSAKMVGKVHEALNE